MSKKKPTKKKAAIPVDDTAQAFIEVIEAVGRRLDSLNVDFCSLSDRVAEIERRLSGCRKAEPTTWIGRLRHRKWFCLPWCR